MEEESGFISISYRLSFYQRIHKCGGYLIYIEVGINSKGNGIKSSALPPLFQSGETPGLEGQRMLDDIPSRSQFASTKRRSTSKSYAPAHARWPSLNEYKCTGIRRTASSRLSLGPDLYALCNILSRVFALFANPENLQEAVDIFADPFV